MIKKIRGQKHKIAGERIVLKRVKPTIQNATEVFETIDRNREYLSKWLEWVSGVKKVEDSLEFLFKSQENIRLGKERVYGVYLKDEYIGNINFFDIDLKNKTAEIGYWLSEEFSGNGYMREAVGLIEKEAFERVGINRLEISCDLNNRASQRVAKGCKYKFEGKAREDFCFKGSFRTSLLFSKLRSEHRS